MIHYISGPGKAMLAFVSYSVLSFVITIVKESHIDVHSYDILLTTIRITDIESQGIPTADI